MTALIASTGDDPVDLATRLRRAFAGGPAIGLGMLGDAGDELAQVPQGTAVVIATSGSTGVPKQVVLGAEALRASAEATAERVGQGGWLLALPASYVAGLQVLVRSIIAGTSPIVLQGAFTPASFATSTRALARTGAESLCTSLVPAQIATLVEAADDSRVLQALRAYQAILVGGQALPEALHERAAELGARIVRTYGSSETSGGCVYDGTPLDAVAVREIEGELQIAGPMLADGYLGDDSLTERTFVRDDLGIRWYRTGDLGIIEDGIVRVHGRADNVIISGGLNVSVDRVERAVRGIPGLAAAVVVGVDDERWGEASVIVAAKGPALRRSETEQLEQARAAVEAEIGRHARPARLILVDELPALVSGKPDRQAIRRIAAELR